MPSELAITFLNKWQVRPKVFFTLSPQPEVGSSFQPPLGEIRGVTCSLGMGVPTLHLRREGERFWGGCKVGRGENEGSIKRKGRSVLSIFSLVFGRSRESVRGRGDSKKWILEEEHKKLKVPLGGNRSWGPWITEGFPITSGREGQVTTWNKEEVRGGEPTEIRASPKVERQGNERWHNASLGGLAGHQGCGCQEGRGRRLRRLWGERLWGIASTGRGGGEVFLSGVFSHREKRFPVQCSPRTEAPETRKRQSVEEPAFPSPSPASQHTHRVSSKRHRSSCSYRPAQPHSARTAPRDLAQTPPPLPHVIIRTRPFPPPSSPSSARGLGSGLPFWQDGGVQL